MNTWAPTVVTLSVQIVAVIFFFGKFAHKIDTHDKRLDEHDSVLDLHSTMHAEQRGWQRGYNQGVVDADSRKGASHGSR